MGWCSCIGDHPQIKKRRLVVKCTFGVLGEEGVG
jgi:hypothetical protein